MKHWALENWIGLAKSIIAPMNAETRALAERVGNECYAREQRGENSSVYHVLASLNGTRCHCYECSPG